MSSFHKAHKAQRRTHKERGQTLARQNRFGLLEKKKDWKLRSQDHKSKLKRKKALTEKARDRNPDEFYYGMINAKVKDGRHVLARDTSNVLSVDEVKHFKSQDLSYIHSKRTAERQKIEKLQAQLHLLGTNDGDHPLNSHTVFCDDKKEAKSLDLAERFDTHESLLTRRHNRVPREQLKKISSHGVISDWSQKKLAKKQKAMYDELKHRMEREGEMTKIMQQLELEKNVMGKGRKVKVKKGNKTQLPVYRWKKERKR